MSRKQYNYNKLSYSDVTEQDIEEFCKSPKINLLFDVLGSHVISEIKKHPLAIYDGLPSNVQELLIEKIEEIGA